MQWMSNNKTVMGQIYKTFALITEKLSQWLKNPSLIFKNIQMKTNPWVVNNKILPTITKANRVMGLIKPKEVIWWEGLTLGKQIIKGMTLRNMYQVMTFSQLKTLRKSIKNVLIRWFQVKIGVFNSKLVILLEEFVSIIKVLYSKME